MASEISLSSTMGLQLITGTHPTSGKNTIRTLSFGIMNNADKDKIRAVADAMAPCLAFPLYSVIRTEKSQID